MAGQTKRNQQEAPNRTPLLIALVVVIVLSLGFVIFQATRGLVPQRPADPSTAPGLPPTNEGTGSSPSDTPGYP
jgi:hypothetical protein